MELKQNTGAIFKNERKQEDKHPEYKGKIDIDGKTYDIALWVKKSKNDKSYFSVKISEPYVGPQYAQTDGPDTNDDLPF